MTKSAMTQPTKKQPACAMCGKPVDPAYKPFCSSRCANLDLHRWLKGAYVIAGEPVDDEDLSPPRRAEEE
jgi:endogenous inhibitor of DNA gyrase (YacG/DUF329 family)